MGVSKTPRRRFEPCSPCFFVTVRGSINTHMLSKIQNISSISDEQLIELYETHGTIHLILQSLGISSSASYYAKDFTARLRSSGVITWNSNQHIDSCDMFIENSKYSRSTVRKRIIRDKLLEYKCAVPRCDNVGVHLGRPLVLQLDHINGISSDNRLANLRWICPNCHSQTETYAGKKNKKIQNKCECGVILHRQTFSGKCKSCSNSSRKYALKFEISREELESLVRTHNLSEIGRMYSVSDKTVKKRCIKHGIPTFTKQLQNKDRK